MTKEQLIKYGERMAEVDPMANNGPLGYAGYKNGSKDMLELMWPLVEACQWYKNPHSKTYGMNDVGGDYEFIARKALKSLEQKIGEK